MVKSMELRKEGGLRCDLQEFLFGLDGREYPSAHLLGRGMSARSAHCHALISSSIRALMNKTDRGLDVVLRLFTDQKEDNGDSAEGIEAVQQQGVGSCTIVRGRAACKPCS